VARRPSASAATGLARLQERLAEVWRARAGEGGPVVVYEDDDEQVLQEYLARRERAGEGGRFYCEDHVEAVGRLLVGSSSA